MALNDDLVLNSVNIKYKNIHTVTQRVDKADKSNVKLHARDA